MTTHEVKGVHAWSCDGCSETFEAAEGEDFGDAWKRAKGEGWAAVQVKGAWQHYCGTCARDT